MHDNEIRPQSITLTRPGLVPFGSISTTCTKVMLDICFNPFKFKRDLEKRDFVFELKKAQRDYLCKKLDIQYITLLKTIKVLKEHDLLIPLGKGLFKVNPLYITE